MADLTEDMVRTIVREELSGAPVIGEIQSQIGVLQSDVSHLQTDVSVLKTDVSELKTDVSELKTDVSELKTDVSELKTEQYRQGVLMESLEGKMDTVIEMLTDNLKVTTKVSDHDGRLQKLEADNVIVKSTVALHSGQLARLGS